MIWKIKNNQPYFLGIRVPKPVYYLFSYLHRSIALTAFLFAFNLALFTAWVWPDTNFYLTCISYQVFAFFMALPFLYIREEEDFNRKFADNVSDD